MSQVAWNSHLATGAVDPAWSRNGMRRRLTEPLMIIDVVVTSISNLRALLL
jgi:hypothetical protein